MFAWWNRFTTSLGNFARRAWAGIKRFFGYGPVQGAMNIRMPASDPQQVVIPAQSILPSNIAPSSNYNAANPANQVQPPQNVVGGSAAGQPIRRYTAEETADHEIFARGIVEDIYGGARRQALNRQKIRKRLQTMAEQRAAAPTRKSSRLNK